MLGSFYELFILVNFRLSKNGRRVVTLVAFGRLLIYDAPIRLVAVQKITALISFTFRKWNLVLASRFHTGNTRALLNRTIEYVVRYGRGSKLQKRITKESSIKRNSAQRNET